MEHTNYIEIRFGAAVARVQVAQRSYITFVLPMKYNFDWFEIKAKWKSS